MVKYFFEGRITGGQSAPILTKDGRLGTLDLVRITITVADPDLDNPSEKQYAVADRMASSPQNAQFYLPFTRTFAQSTARIGESISFAGTPQPIVMLTQSNRQRAYIARAKIVDRGRWWRMDDPPKNIQHIADGLDTRFEAGLLTFGAYQSQWKQITKVNGVTPRGVLGQLAEQKQMWMNLIRQMSNDDTNQVRQLIIPTPGVAMNVTTTLPGDDLLNTDPALYDTVTKRHQQFARWLKLIPGEA